MKSAIAIITYNRVHALQEMLRGIDAHFAQYPLAIFDDLSNRDGTEKFLRTGMSATKPRPDLMAEELSEKSGSPRPPRKHFLGTHNLGVTGNSNRALKWLMDETDAEHFILCNDDLHVTGDFVQFYGKAHVDLQVGMFCFCDFTHHPSYQWVDINQRGYRIKLCPRMTGIMISMHRKVAEQIGYFDTVFTKFGEEHCDFTNRARLVGAISLSGMMQTQIDLHHNLIGQPEQVLLKHQEVETSMTGPERKRADQESYGIMQAVGQSYHYRDVYRPFGLHRPKFVGATREAGIPADQISSTYDLVTDFTPRPL
jgi:hypothetical protein